MKKENTVPASATESIAVIGMQGRFPGARNVDELWENLKNGVESISTFSEAELTAAGIDPSYLNVPGFVNRGCVLEGIDQFDAGFFGYSARDAETMDPQQRIFLECAWESLEQAGCDPYTYPGMIGVFAGSDQSSYLYQIYSSVDLSAYGYGGMMAIGNEKDYLATQVSYKLNLRGPSLAIQTSCSTSLVAVCVACQNLVHGYCDMALAGGVGISVPQRKGYWYQAGGIVSPDGHCKPFDASGQGTVVGNGVGIVVLKRLSEAMHDGDNILAVIKGFALNNDGFAKVGYTAPSVEGQSNVIRMAQRMAGVEPDTIGYIEAHGTATALGDPVEVGALTKAFSERTNKKQFCAIGSLKSNVGHLSSAAGISGLIKGILVVKNGQIPKSLHYTQPNPQIDFAQSPFFVASELMDWPLNGSIRRAGVSSFGVGGTNAHVVLEEAPAVKTDPAATEKQILVLSARSPSALEKVTDNLIRHVENTPGADLADVAFTCQVGRRSFSHRRAIVFDRSDRTGLLNALKARDPKLVITSQTDLQDRAVVFLFSGQGTQYVDMGLELYQTEKTFREHVDTCCAILKGEMGCDLRDILYPAQDREAAAERLKQTDLTQPALFTIEYALAQLWMEWGIVPKAMLGHSIGEYVAACIAGVMTLSEALSVVAMRGRLMASMPSGSMLAVSLPEAAVQPVLSPVVSLAAVNAPSICVLSGPTRAIDPLEKQFTDQGLPCRRLHTSHAFHSSMMDAIIPQFVDRLRRISLKPPQIAYLSNVTGSWIRPELATSPEYWGAHLRQTVRFADNLREVMAFPDLALLETGPGQTLGSLARQQGSRVKSQLVLASMRAAQEEGSDAAFLRQTVAKLWLGGVRIAWRSFHQNEKRQIVSLPTYPFARQRFWLGPLEQADASAAMASVQERQAELGVALATSPSPLPNMTPRDIADWFFVPAWKPDAAVPRGHSEDNSGPWLIFEDRAGVGEAVSQRLRALGCVVNSVVQGDSFRAGESHFELRPDEKSSYETLIKTLRERNELPARILHLWSVDEAASGLSPAEGFDDAQRRGFYSLVFLAQALGQSGSSSPVQLGVVTDRLQAVLEDEDLRSAEGTVWGACKVISQEYPHLRCRSIDVVLSQPGIPEALVEEFGKEFQPVVAYRNSRRWLQEFQPASLRHLTSKPALLRDDGVYLITGGVGNIGLILAEAIARTVKAKLVLIGRSSFPERQQWDQYVTANPKDTVSARIRKIRAIEKFGADVMVVQADVTDRNQMRAALASARTAWGPVHGVIHGAANLAPNAFGPTKDLDQSMGDGHFRPKAHGLLMLEELLQAEPPAFVMLLSSLSAVLGGLGLAAYAASNAYLDAEAQRQNARSTTKWISVNWDAWDFSPGADGRSGVVSASQGQEAFQRIIDSLLPQVVVSTTPLAERLEQWVQFAKGAKAPRPLAAAASAAPANGSHDVAGEVHARPELSSQYVSPSTETEKRIEEVWEHLLGVAPIGIHDKFFELGGHSLLAIQVLARLREIFELDLPVQRIFEAPTIAQLAESIDRERGTVSPIVAVESGESNSGGNLEDMMKLVEGLSEHELDSLLAEAEAIEKRKVAHDRPA